MTKRKDSVREDQRAEGLKMASAEGGEPVQKTDKPAAVVVVKRERSDKPLTAAEMADKTSEINKSRLAKGWKLMDLEHYPVTPMAQDLRAPATARSGSSPWARRGAMEMREVSIPRATAWFWNARANGSMAESVTTSTGSPSRCPRQRFRIS